MPSAPASPSSTAAEPAGDRLSLSSTGRASEVDVVRRLPSNRWAWTELLRDRDPNFVQRNFHPRQRQRDPEVVAAFGTDTPHSGDVLLHYAGDPPPDAPRRTTPVLLVHGASKAGTFWWDPHENGSEQGLPQKLRDQGFQVYFVSFAHNHDDNFLQAEQMANAIERVKELTGREQVDLVAHSKGAMAARLYTSDVREEWMTPYRGDVRRLVFVGAPLGGIDFSFRHPSANYALYGDSDDPRLNAPISWEKMMAWGRMVDTSDVGFSQKGSDYWPGQRQMLARWDQRYGLSAVEPDWYTTYNGGRGFVSRSNGIDHYIEQGGSLIERLNRTPVDPRVEVAVLAGDRPNIPGIVNEFTGPSDGLLFVRSALATSPGTNVVARDVLDLHHKALVAEDEGQDWILDVLAREQFPEPLPELTEAELEAYDSAFDEERERGERQVKEMLAQAALNQAGPATTLPLL